MQELQCYLDVIKPSDYIDCIVASSSNPIFTLVYYGIMVVLITGWSRINGIGKGMMVGSFFSILIGLSMFVLETISIANIFLPILLFFVGLFIAIVKT